MVRKPGQKAGVGDGYPVETELEAARARIQGELRAVWRQKQERRRAGWSWEHLLRSQEVRRVEVDLIAPGSHLGLYLP